MQMKTDFTIDTQLLQELTTAWMKELLCRLRDSRGERALLIHNPHTIHTISDIFDLDLNRDAQEKAELLASLVYKHVYDRDPVSTPLPGIGRCNRYSDDDLWIVRTAVTRVNQGANSPAPPIGRVSIEDWIRLCTEANL